MNQSPKKYDPAWVAHYYNEFGEREWCRLTRSVVDEVSLHIHARLLTKHLRKGMKVLEIGAGAGRFTQIMAESGCRITVTDISETQIKLNRAKAAELGFAGAVEEWSVLDICDLSQFSDQSFDVVAAYGGPISYVFDEADIALQECRRVLKEEGVFLSSVMSLWGTCHRALNEVVKLPPKQNQLVTATGDLTEQTIPGNKHHCRMYRSADFGQLLERNALSVVEMSASNFLSTRWESELSDIRKDEVRWNELLRMETEACAEAGCWDSGTHLIAVCIKRPT